MSWSYNPAVAETTTVWANPISLATTLGITFVFSSSGYLDVSVHRVNLPCGIPYLQYGGLPHSDICGSHRMCRSPQLFAAYHVLHRLWKPRHSPYALIQLVALSTHILITQVLFRTLSFDSCFSLLLKLLFSIPKDRSDPLYPNMSMNVSLSTAADNRLQV